MQLAKSAVIAISTLLLLNRSTCHEIQELKIVEALEVHLISNLVILIRSNEDISNCFLQCFLYQEYASQTIFTYANYGESVVEADAVFVTEMAHLNRTLHTYTRSHQIYFVILTDADIDKPRIVRMLHDLWITKQVYQVYIFSDSGGFLFDQFHYKYERGVVQFGELVPLKQHRIRERFYDMNGFPLKVQLFNAGLSRIEYNSETDTVESVDGADVQMAHMLAEKLNFRPVFLTPNISFGYRLPNGSFDGALGLILLGKIDIILTGYFVRDYYTNDIEFTVAVDSDEMCCYVKKADPYPQVMLPILAVKPSLWIGLFMAATLSSLLWIGLRHVNLRLHKSSSPDMLRDHLRILLDTWVVCVRVNILRFPDYLSERVFVLYLCLLSVMIGALFESSLSTAYVKPFYYKDINTLQELDDSRRTILYKFPTFKDDAVFSNKLHHVKFEYFEENKINTILTRVTDDTKYAGLMRVAHVMSEKAVSIRTGKIHPIGECVMKYRLAYILRKHSPYTDVINGILLRILEVGLFGHWITEMHFKEWLHLTKKPKFDESRRYQTLSLDNLQLAFYTLALGYVSGAVVLAFELYCRPFKDTKG